MEDIEKELLAVIKLSTEEHILRIFQRRDIENSSKEIKTECFVKACQEGKLKIVDYLLPMVNGIDFYFCNVVVNDRSKSNSPAVFVAAENVPNVNTTLIFSGLS